MDNSQGKHIFHYIMQTYISVIPFIQKEFLFGILTVYNLNFDSLKFNNMFVSAKYAYVLGQSVSDDNIIRKFTCVICIISKDVISIKGKWRRIPIKCEYVIH